MSVRSFPKKKDHHFKEAIIYSKNIVEAAIDFDCDCPEIVNACKVMDFADELSIAGWKVKITLFENENYPLLYVRAKRKRKVN